MPYLKNLLMQMMPPSNRCNKIDYEAICILHLFWPRPSSCFHSVTNYLAVSIRSKIQPTSTFQMMKEVMRNRRRPVGMNILARAIGVNSLAPLSTRCSRIALSSSSMSANAICIILIYSLETESFTYLPIKFI